MEYYLPGRSDDQWDEALVALVLDELLRDAVTLEIDAVAGGSEGRGGSAEAALMSRAAEAHEGRRRESAVYRAIRRRVPRLAVPLNAMDADDVSLFRSFALLSAHAAAMGSDGRPLFEASDGARAVVITLAPEQADHLAGRIEAAGYNADSMKPIS